MKQESLIAATAKRRPYSSYLGEINPAPDNLLDRDFRAAAPDEKWLTDITEFQLPAGKVYLSPMIDCFDGMVVSWSIGTRPDAELVNTMLDGAVETIASGNDRSNSPHYRGPGWLSHISEAKLRRSMSRKGCSPDNAACEGFFGRLKTELFYPRNWRSSRCWTSTSAGTMQSGSRSRWALAVPSNIDGALGSWHKPVQVFIRTPKCGVFIWRR